MKRTFGYILIAIAVIGGGVLLYLSQVASKAKNNIKALGLFPTTDTTVEESSQAYTPIEVGQFEELFTSENFALNQNDDTVIVSYYPIATQAFRVYKDGVVLASDQYTRSNNIIKLKTPIAANSATIIVEYYADIKISA